MYIKIKLQEKETSLHQAAKTSMVSEVKIQVYSIMRSVWILAYD